MEKTQHICFFNTTKFWGGGEKLHLEYAQEFRKRNYPVSIVAKGNSPFYEKCKTEGFKVKTFSTNNFSFLNLVKKQRLINYFKENKIHTVFISASPDMKIAAPAAKKAGVKNIIYLRGLAAPIKNTPINKKLLTKTLTHIIANSEETKQKMLGNFSSDQLIEKIKVIYHGIDLQLFDEQMQKQPIAYQRIGAELILGNAGRLTKQKGQQHLIALAVKLKEKKIDFKILIAGSGEEEEALKEQIIKNNLTENVILLGFVRDMEGFMKSIDVFVLTSIWEGFGYVIVEAMAANKPVVAFNITSNPEIIANNETGYLIDYPNIENLSEKIELLKDGEKRKILGERARLRVENKFQLKTIITEIETYLGLC